MEQFLNQVVVIDVEAMFVFIGTLLEVTDKSVVLKMLPFSPHTNETL